MVVLDGMERMERYPGILDYVVIEDKTDPRSC